MSNANENILKDNIIQEPKKYIDSELKKVSFFPKNWKEWGVFIISLLFFVLLIVLFYRLFGAINNFPQEKQLSNKEWVIIDPFERTVQIYSMLTPILAAFLSFWFGYTIQEKRIKKGQKSLEKANQVAVEARGKKQKSDDKLYKVKSLLDQMLGYNMTSNAAFGSLNDIIPTKSLTHFGSKVIAAKGDDDVNNILASTDLELQAPFLLDQLNKMKQILEEQ